MQSREKWTPLFSSAQSKYIEIFGPPNNLFAEIFRPSELKFLSYLDSLEILYWYPLLIYNVQRCMDSLEIFDPQFLMCPQIWQLEILYRDYSSSTRMLATWERTEGQSHLKALHYRSQRAEGLILLG